MEKYFMHPVERIAISGRFIEGRHGGIDYGWEKGHQTDTKILAAASGKVTESDYGSIVGNYIVIYHGTRDGKDIYTRYLHLRERKVNKGDSVKIGQCIGIMGETGSDCYGVHLHFDYVPCKQGEGFVLSRRINPASFLYVYKDQRYIEDQDGVKLKFCKLKISEAKKTESKSAAVKSKYAVYTVKKGDTLYKIARAHGISLSKIKKANTQIENYNLIYEGQKINIPGKEAKTVKYKVKKGDTMWQIADAHNITLQALINANPQISNPNIIKVGQKLNIPVV